MRLRLNGFDDKPQVVARLLRKVQRVRVFRMIVVCRRCGLGSGPPCPNSLALRVSKHGQRHDDDGENEPKPTQSSSE